MRNLVRFFAGVGIGAVIGSGIYYCMFRVLLVAALLICHFAFAAIPPEAHHHRRELVRTAQQQFGLDAPIATLAAQIHQESRWRANAQSPAGAKGMAQFMPDTAAWMPSIDPSLKSVQPYNPAWAMRAMVSYDKWLLARVSAADTCEQWAMALAAYNGGLGWVQRDIKKASLVGMDTRRWFGHVERFNAGRHKAAFTENRHYPTIILTMHEPLYARAGWGHGVCQQRWPA